MSTQDTPHIAPDLYQLGVLDGPAEKVFNDLTRLVSRQLEVPVSLVSIIEQSRDRQFFKSMQGLQEPWATYRQTPLSHSYCKTVVATDAPLVVNDARADADFHDHPATRDLGIGAYLGVPIRLGDGSPIGALCAIDVAPRDWAPDDIETLQILERAVSCHINLKAALLDSEAARKAAEQAFEAKSRFIAVISHELRNPVNGIMGALDLLRDADLPEKYRHYLDLSDSACRALLRQLNDILEAQRIEAGVIDIETEPVSIPHIIEDVVHACRSIASRHQNRVAQEVSLTAPRHVSDGYRLRQVLSNFLTNAAKFTEGGTLTVRALHIGQENGREQLELSVEDTGIGISEADQAKIFEEFHVVDSGYRRDVQGAGLGLAICAKIVDKMGGQIGVDSTPGQGSRFWVRLSLEMSEVEQDIPTQAPRTDHGPRSWPGAVLVVDDSLVNRTIITALLQAQGVTDISEADDGAQGAAAATARAFDLIITDISMPVMDGLEMTEQLRRSAGPSQKARIVALTGLAMPEDIARFEAAGLDSYLIKPLKSDALEAVLSPGRPNFR